jgi:hypothetical protein
MANVLNVEQKKLLLENWEKMSSKFIMFSVVFLMGCSSHSLQGTWSQGTPGVFTPTLEFRAESIFLDKCASNLSNWESNSSSK